MVGRSRLRFSRHLPSFRPLPNVHDLIRSCAKLVGTVAVVRVQRYSDTDARGNQLAFYLKRQANASSSVETKT
jgi:hypothetical protein